MAVFAFLTCIVVLGGVLFTPKNNNAKPEKDAALTTRSYRTEIEVQRDNSYVVNEQISVSFNEARHGIYRNIPYRGYTKEHNPVYAEIEMVKSNEPYDSENEEGNTIYKFGEEDTTKTAFDYNFTYRYTPKLDSQYNTVTFNLFPTGWKSSIPEGSSFQVSFPKSFDHSLLSLYYGAYGETKDASNILDLNWEGNVLTGKLKEPLSTFEGLSFFVTMPEGYFQSTNTTWNMKQVIMIIIVTLSVIIMLLFLVFGRDKRLTPVKCYKPPEGIDSALAGYLVDGSIDTKDIMSLVLYLASKGYLRIKLEDQRTSFIKLRNLDQQPPAYCKTIFNGIFEKAEIGEEVPIENLKYKFATNIQKATEQLKEYVNKGEWGGVYKKDSIASRIVGILFAGAGMILYLIGACITSTMSGFLITLTIGMVLYYVVGLILLCYASDKWYALEREGREALAKIGVFSILFGFVSYGIVYMTDAARQQVMDFRIPFIVMAVASTINAIVIAFMKKRTKKTAECMNALVGFREYIEERKLPEHKLMIEANPDLFYDILPYAYVFGLSDAWLNTLEDAKVEPSDWIFDARGIRTNPHCFDMMLIYALLGDRMNDATKTFTSVKVETNASSGSGGSFGGGSTGGFSGGGFGGGGGGSW